MDNHSRATKKQKEYKKERKLERRTMERRFTFPNCTVVVHLPKNQDTVRKATEKFIREVERKK